MDDRHDSGIRFWRMAGGDGSRRGCYARAIRVESRPAQRLAVQGAAQASVVFDCEGRVVVADLAGGVQAFDARGRRLWQTVLPGGVTATPAAHPTRPLVFVGTHTGTVSALDTTQGLTRWTKILPTRGDPRILSDLLHVPPTDSVVLSSWGGRFFQLSATTGTEQRSWDAGVSPCAAASADREGNVYCLRAVLNQGVELVRVTREGRETVLNRSPEDKRGLKRALVAAAPVLDEARDRLYFLTNPQTSGQVFCWSLSAGTVLWSHSLEHSVQATPAVGDDGSLWLADLAGEVQVMGPDGQRRCRIGLEVEYLLAGAVCDAAGTGYVGDPLGRLHRIDPRGRAKVLCDTQRSLQARPAFGPEGWLYVPGTDRTVYVFASSVLSRSNQV